ncbi:hypothetical protein AB1Y20_012038 [Prymnesium parvum]|uniref:Uncharacterized protein n=1 Tax=Prymnesium parvum TaxID=97485 RepID=A0AB34IQX5_PRYPA
MRAAFRPFSRSFAAIAKAGRAATPPHLRRSLPLGCALAGGAFAWSYTDVSAAASKPKVCVVVGAGSKYATGRVDTTGVPEDALWGLGGALPIEFAKEGYSVVIMSRSFDNLRPIEEHINTKLEGHCVAIECDCSSEESIKQAFAQVRQQVGEVDVLCYNAGYAPPSATATPPPGMGSNAVEMIDPSQCDMAWQVHVKGLLLCAQQVLPSMRERREGSVLVTGNSMSLRGSIDMGRAAPSKAAQRSLVQVMAQEYKPFRVHVAHVVIDGAIDAPHMRTVGTWGAKLAAREKEAPGSKLLRPAEVSRLFIYLAQQHPSIWTHEIFLTPYEVSLGQRL